jgi:hypothetical protein
MKERVNSTLILTKLTKLLLTLRQTDHHTQVRLVETAANEMNSLGLSHERKD